MADPAPGAPSATDDSASPPSSASADDGGAAAAVTGVEHAFFAGIRRTGIARGDGWVGGVCAGIGDRLGIDPLLIRGIAVVIAVLGGPVVLLYAIGWFLLPDGEGTIHAQELARGRPSRALAGIASVALLSLLPLTQGFWYAGAAYWGEPDLLASGMRIAWTAVVLGLAVAVVVWIARRATSGSRGPVVTRAERLEAVADTPIADAPVADAPHSAGSQAVPEPEASEAAAAAEPALRVADPGEPPAAPADASAEELAAWRAGQEQWQRQRSLWIAEQRRRDRELRQAAAHARAQEAHTRAQERRRARRLLRPRANAAIVGVVLGAALILGAMAAAVSATRPELAERSAGIGTAVGMLALGVGTVAVGAARRRSGVLTALGAVALIATVVTATMPQGRTVLFPGAASGLRADGDGSYLQLAGDTFVSSLPAPSSTPAEAATIDLWQGFGSVWVSMRPDRTVRIEAVLRDGEALMEEFTDSGDVVTPLEPTGVSADGEQRFDLTLGEGEPDLTVRLWLGRGDLRIQQLRPDPQPEVQP